MNLVRCTVLAYVRNFYDPVYAFSAKFLEKRSIAQKKMHLKNKNTDENRN